MSSPPDAPPSYSCVPFLFAIPTSSCNPNATANYGKRLESRNLTLPLFL